MKYQVQLDTQKQLFIVINPKNKRQAIGTTIQQALAAINN